MFFDTAHGRFHSFNVLIKNFENNLKEFKIIIPSLDSGFVKKLNEYREQGNSAAHTLEIEINKQVLETKKEELEFIIRTLVRLYNNI